MKRFISSILVTLLVLTQTVFQAPTAYADFEWPKFDINIDLSKGFDGIVDQLPIPDELPILGTPFIYYPKESIGINITKNLGQFVGEFASYLDPMKPAASVARMILGMTRPFIEPLIKKILPAPVKGAAYWVKDQIAKIVKGVNNSIVKDIVLPLWEIVVGPIDDLLIDIVDILAEEQKEEGAGAGGGGSGEQMIGAIGTPGQEVIPTPWVNRLPVGMFENIDENGIATGWALDPDHPDVSLEVTMSPILGQFPDHVTANLPHEGINYSGNHGFSYRIPSGMRDGKKNPLEAYVRDHDEWEKRVMLPGSPRNYQLTSLAAGELEYIDEEGVVRGWAVDPDMVSEVVEVKFYLDGKTLLGTVTTTVNRPEFTFNINPNDYRDGVRHKITAYVLDKNDRNDVREVPLEGELSFMYAKRIQISFESDIVNVQQGSRVFNTVIGVANQNHLANVYLDDALFDANMEDHGYPLYNYEKRLGVKNDGTEETLRSFEFNFKTPKDISLGEHTIMLESSFTSYMGFEYKGSFKINVIPYTQLRVLAPEKIVPETPFTLTMTGIPQQVSFFGKDANASVQGISFVGDGGSYSIQSPEMNLNEDGTITLKMTVPYEAGYIVSLPSRIQLLVYVDYKNELAREEFRASEYMHYNYFPGKTSDGRDPLFEPLCRSTLKPVLALGGGTGSVNGSVKDFACSADFTVIVTGVNEGKPFSLTLPKDYYIGKGDEVVIVRDENAPPRAPSSSQIVVPEKFYVKKSSEPVPPLYYAPSRIGWDGNIERFSLAMTENWIKEYTAVQEITVTVTDEKGNTASITVPLSLPYQVRVIPVEGDQLLPGGPMKLETNGFRDGHLVRLRIDQESAKEFYLSGKKKGWDEGAPILSDTMFLPSWIKPGKHRLTMEDLESLDVNKNPIYRAVTTFEVAGEVEEEDVPVKVDEQKKKDQPMPEKKKEVKLQPVVSVMPVSVQTTKTVQISLSGFNPLATVTIYLRKADAPQSGGTKLSGYADYTDSAGALVKSVTIPGVLAAGEYVIVATDIQGLSAFAPLTIEAAPEPKPVPKPAPKPAHQPKPEPAPEPELDTAPLPDENESVRKEEPEPAPNPTCDPGYTYSPTFQSCIEDTPPASEFEGKPCDESIPMYVQRGCIP